MRVSPEFTLRPSLSADYEPRYRRRPAARVAGVYPPAFVERCYVRHPPLPAQARVAGVYPPAFVERGRRARGPRRAGMVSPEFTLRPSLSVTAAACAAGRGSTVSPEFTLRPSLSGRITAGSSTSARGVSPEFTLRPSLSAPVRTWPPARRISVSPEFTLRPSLSGGPSP